MDKFKSKFYHKKIMAGLCDDARQVIIRRCEDEISLAYSYAPHVTTIPKPTTDDMDPMVSIICKTEVSGTFVKEIEFTDFYVSCMLQCVLNNLN